VFAAKQNIDQGALIELDPDAIFERQEAELAEQLQDQIERNVRALLRDHERFVVRTKYEAVYKGVEGIARTPHLRKVLKSLHTAGVTTSNQVGDLYAKLVIRAPDAQP